MTLTSVYGLHTFFQYGWMIFDSLIKNVVLQQWLMTYQKQQVWLDYSGRESQGNIVMRADRFAWIEISVTDDQDF